MPDSLQIALQNNSERGEEVWAYVTGMALQHGGRRCLLQADGRSLHFPRQPPAILSPLEADCAIALNPPGGGRSNPRVVTVPQMAGGRVWISRGSRLTFLLNPSGGDDPALVEPSVLNPSDANAGVDFAFAEFTLNDAQLYANISYVDFVPRLPVALHLRQASGLEQAVLGMPPDGADRLAAGLREQARRDGRPWDRLAVPLLPPVGDGSGGGGGGGGGEEKTLRVLNATHGAAVGASFDGYFEPYVDEVMAAYEAGAAGGRKFTIDTQCGAGVLEGYTTRGGPGAATIMVGGQAFAPPTTADILGCNTGPFTTAAGGEAEAALRNAIIPRLAAAFARTSLLVAADHHHPSPPDTFYARDPCNHYARLAHAANVDAKGYAFAYDDVQPGGGDDQSGKVNAGDPVLFTVTVGGMQHAGWRQPSQPQPQPQPAPATAGGYQRPPMPLPPREGGAGQQQGGYERPPMPLPPPEQQQQQPPPGDQQRSRPPPPPPKSHALKEKLGSLRDKFLR